MNGDSQDGEGISKGVWVAVLTLVVLSLALMLVIHVNRKRRQSGSPERGPDQVRNRRGGLKASADLEKSTHGGTSGLEVLKDEVLEGLGEGEGGESASVMRSRLRKMKRQGKIDKELYSSVMEDIDRLEKEDVDL